MAFLFMHDDKIQHRRLYSPHNNCFFSNMDMTESHALTYKELSGDYHAGGSLKQISRIKKNMRFTGAGFSWLPMIGT